MWRFGCSRSLWAGSFSDGFGLRSLSRMALLDEPLSRTRSVSEARIAGNVRVSRS